MRFPFRVLRFVVVCTASSAGRISEYCQILLGRIHFVISGLLVGNSSLDPQFCILLISLGASVSLDPFFVSPGKIVLLAQISNPYASDCLDMLGM